MNAETRASLIRIIHLIRHGTLNTMAALAEIEAAVPCCVTTSARDVRDIGRGAVLAVACDEHGTEKMVIP